MGKLFSQQSDDFKERFEVDKPADHIEVNKPIDQSSSKPASEKPIFPYEVHREGPLTYFDCYFEDLKRSRQSVSSHKSRPFSQLLLKGLASLSLLVAILAVGFVVFQSLNKRPQTVPKVSLSSFNHPR